MTEEQLIKLKFEIQDGDGYYYYTKDIVDGLSFITNANTESDEGEWFVEMFDTDSIRYYDYKTLKKLIKLLKKGINQTNLNQN